MTRKADVIIIGAGVIGAAVAFEMAKKGWKTLNIDRNTQTGHGSTAGSCAIVRMHYSTLEGTAFAWEGYHYWRDWAEYLGLPSQTTLAEFREVGCLVLKTEANAFMVQHIATSKALNIPFEEWNAHDITNRLPIYNLDSFAPARSKDDPAFGQSNGGQIEGGVFWPNAGFVNDPALSAQNLASAAKLHGGEFLLGADIVAIVKENSRVSGVKLSDGSIINAPIVVNVAGPGSASINEMARVTGDMNISTRPLRQEVVHMPAPEGFDFERDGMIISDSDIACYARPEHGNHILVGSEDPECDPHHWVDSDTDYDREFSDQWTTQAMRFGQRVPSLGIPNRTRGVVDLYDASTDWIPIYDRSCLPGFYMAIGSSGNQYKNAPIAGKMMAELIEYVENGGDHDTVPLQFNLPYIKRKFDVGFYSRKREINQDSSFSVLG